MNDKLLIENREFYFHPTYLTYAGSLDGFIVHAITRIPTVGVINEKGFSEIIIEDNWGQSKYIYLHDFIWECFHGLLKEGEKIKHINGKPSDNRLQNLKMIHDYKSYV